MAKKMRHSLPTWQCFCKDCGIELVPYENWIFSSMTYRRYYCNDCYRENVNKKRMYVNGVNIPMSHPLFKSGRYKSFEDAAFLSLQEQGSGSTEGYVYVITNKAWPGWVKIGMAVDAEDRLNGYQTSSPHRDYKLEHFVKTNDRRASESEAHTKALRLSANFNNEWFEITVEQAKHILDNLDEQHNGLSKEASKNKKENKLQKRSQQEDLWTYAENKEAERASGSS